MTHRPMPTLSTTSAPPPPAQVIHPLFLLISPTLQSVSLPSIKMSDHPVHLFIHQSKDLSSVHLSIDSSINSSVLPSIHSSISSFTNQCVHPLIHRFFRLSIHPSFHSDMSLSIHQSIDSLIIPTTCRQSVHPSLNSFIHPSVRHSLFTIFFVLSVCEDNNYYTLFFRFGEIEVGQRFR